jgi:hypothetical protein
MKLFLKFRDVPGFSPLFADYAEGAGNARSLFVRAPNAEALLAASRCAMNLNLPPQELDQRLLALAQRCHSGARTLANIEELCGGRSIAVWAGVRPESRGGCFSDWLKAATAARLAGWICERAAPAVPILFSDISLTADDRALSWGRAISEAFADWGLILSDPSITGNPPWDQPWRGVSPESAPELQARAEERLCDAGYQAWIVGRFPIHSDRSAAMSLQAHCHIIPVAACIADESDIYQFAREQVIFEGNHIPPPVIWPRMSATIIDERSRKMLMRRRLELTDLYAGVEALAEGLKQKETAAAERLNRLEGEVTGRLAELDGLAPDGDRLQRGIGNSKMRMLYQINKLRDAVRACRRSQCELLMRQAPQLCAALAPQGSLQERELTASQIVDRYSHALTQIMNERLDPWIFAHQLIFL